MSEVDLFIALLALVVVVALAAERLRRVPPPVALVVGGAIAGALPFAPEVKLDPDVIFFVFLPPILYPSAFAFAAEDVRANLRPIAWLAIGLVPATMVAIAAVAHVVAGIAWAPAFALGAVLAPTDPVAASAVIRSSDAPGRMATILEGESLVNDATALSCLKIAVAAVGSSLSAAHALGEFALVAAGGAAIGCALGWLASRLRARVDDAGLETVIAVLLAYGSFVLADRLGVSGVLATVAAGFMVGLRSHVTMSPGIRIAAESFWRVTQFLAESILFLLIGLAFAQVLDDPATRPPLELVGIAALVVVTAVASRFAWMFSVPHLAARLDRAHREEIVGRRERVVLGWAGLRGAVSVAAALSLPVHGFPERGTLIAVALGAIVALLVLPALTIPRLLRATGLAGQADDAHERRARASLAEAAIAGIDGLDGAETSRDVRRLVRGRYEHRLDEYRSGDGDNADAGRRRVYSAAVDSQRRRLHELRDAGEVSGELLRDLERDLDFEQEAHS